MQSSAHGRRRKGDGHLALRNSLFNIKRIKLSFKKRSRGEKIRVPPLSEQRTENPRVGGSIPPLAIHKYLSLNKVGKTFCSWLNIPAVNIQ